MFRQGTLLEEFVVDGRFDGDSGSDRVRPREGALSREEWIAENPGKPFPHRRAVHGTPITPEHLLQQLKGSSFCVSFAYPYQLDQCIDLVSPEGILVLDNGAYTKWKSGRGRIDRNRYWPWANHAQARCDVAVAVIPDVIGGSEDENWLEASYAIREGYSQYPERAMFIWHLDDSLENLARAAQLFNFVGLGSCDEYDVQRHPSLYLKRLRQASTVIDIVSAMSGRRPFVHLMRGLGKLHRAIRYDSADSTNIARNHNRTKHRPRHVEAMAARIWAKIDSEQKWLPRKGLPTSNFDP